MKKANKEVLLSVSMWLMLVMFPIFFLGIIFNEPILNAMIDHNAPKSVFLVILAGIFIAIQDTSAHHYSTSILSKWNQRWWDADVSWLNKYELVDGVKTTKRKKYKVFGFETPFNTLVQFSDAWHFFKTLSIFCFVGAIVLYEPIFSHKIIDVLLYGFFYNLYFVAFYNRILKLK